MSNCYLGVDVGTGSVRAGVFDAAGALLSYWRAVCASVREAIERSGAPPESIKGVGFDATCSLVALGENGKPIAIGPSDDPERNIIVWMDHRATDQARRINSTGHALLDYVGGAISPEMETPKLLWLAENRPDSFKRAWQFMDLADFLTWRASGSLVRSLCPVTCKWTYLAHERRWDESYFRVIGLGALADEGFRRIGVEIAAPGSALGDGLTLRAANELGLVVGTPVGAGLIDAHAGGLGTVGGRGLAGNLLSRMAYVFGTSACTMTTTSKPAFVPGVWGPYYSAMVPGYWLNEGGQTAAGAAIDRLVRLHPHADELARKARAQSQSLTQWLSLETERRCGGAAARHLVGGLHVVPEFLGNRAPFADPDARALIAGLGADGGIDGLIALYLAGLCGLGYGVRQIVRAQREQGVLVDTIVVSGGAGQSPLARQVLADTTGLVVAASTSPEPVLLGAAILGAIAAGRYRGATEAMEAMSSLGGLCLPQTALAEWHEKRFGAFEELQQVGRRIRDVAIVAAA